MTKMDIITKLIPVILAVCIIWYNMRKIRKNMNVMKQEHCSGSCQGCAHSGSCGSYTKEDKED